MAIPRWTAVEVEAAVAAYFGVRENVIVPNVSWGFFRDGHEADLVLLKPSGWADEIEIKVSKADIKRDLGKNGGRGHVRNLFMRRLWFAVPEHLAGDPCIPEFAGILSLSRGDHSGARVRIHSLRAPKVNPAAKKLSEHDQLRLMRLGCMRIWGLKTGRGNDVCNKRAADDGYRELLDARLRWSQGKGLHSDFVIPYPS